MAADKVVTLPRVSWKMFGYSHILESLTEAEGRYDSSKKLWD